MSLLHALLPLFAQVGPFTAPGTTGTPFPETVKRPSPLKVITQAAPQVPQRSQRAADCVAAVDDDAENAVDLAETWLKTAAGPDKVDAQMCLGLAHSGLDQWADAEAAFLAGRDAAGADRMMRARLGAMAGNAALAAAAPDRALTALDAARAEVKGLASPALEARIALDRSRALVALKRDGEAQDALADARNAAPSSAEAWLLSATLSRRQGNLAEAQARIQRAAELLPIDPAIGLEAGVIAVLAGRDEAARKSWQSVLLAAPDSAEAATAKTYLAQLAPAPEPRATGVGR